MRHFIPGLTEEYERERRLREEVYLGLPHFLCGIPLRQITPRIFALLLFIRTPFIGSGEVTPASIGQFLWACHRDYDPSKPRERDKFLRSLIGMNWAGLEYGIDEFLNATFLDAPQGGKDDSTPYVCGIAWMEYRMLIDPFRMTPEAFLDTPLRIIYQRIRCHDAVNGVPLFNRYSDKVKADFVAELNADSKAFDELQKGRN